MPLRMGLEGWLLSEHRVFDGGDGPVEQGEGEGEDLGPTRPGRRRGGGQTS